MTIESLPASFEKCRDSHPNSIWSLDGFDYHTKDDCLTLFAVCLITEVSNAYPSHMTTNDDDICEKIEKLEAEFESSSLDRAKLANSPDFLFANETMEIQARAYFMYMQTPNPDKTFSEHVHNALLATMSYTY